MDTLQDVSINSRVYLFDKLRGLMIINMILYHLIYDLVYIYNINLTWFNGPFADIWQEIICGTFIFIAGACSIYSKNNLKRGLRLIFFAYLLTLVTYILVPEFKINFGILHCLGASMILFYLIRPLINNLTNALGIIIFALIYLITFNVSNGFLGISPKVGIELPQIIYQTNFLYMIGLPSTDYYSSDYFPLVPYFFLFLSGIFYGRWGIEGHFPAWFYNNKGKCLIKIGKNSLWIYLIHQPIILGLLWLAYH